MPFTFFDHTGDIGVRLDGRTPDALFADAAAAFCDAVTDASLVRPLHTRTLALESTALDLLLVDFLAEILFYFDVEQFLTCTADVRVDPASDTPACRLQATLGGEPFDAARHQIKMLIKAVTYHALNVTQDAGGWRATVVFDI